MSLRHFTLTITAAAQRLSSVLSPTTPGGSADEAYREIQLTTETDCFIGNSAVTTADYGVKILSAATLPVKIGPFESGPVKLSEIYVVGTSGKLHVLGVPF